jgi:exosortase E/protease (VPEID-CTERM system)
LPVRLSILAGLFALELLAVSIWLDGDMLRGSHGLVALIGEWGSWSIRVVIATALGFLIFGESRSVLKIAGADLSRSPVVWPLLGGHAAAMAVFVFLSVILFGRHPAGMAGNAVAIAWILAGLTGIVLAACALIPARLWIAQIRALSDILVFAIAAALAASLLGNYARTFWVPLARWTLELVSVMLQPFVSQVAHPAAFIIGTQKFRVEIAPECSGYEGIGLILALSSAWLWFMRRQWRFPHALLLIPAGVVAIWVLNAVRIAALILIGNAGAEQIALGGFHSQAGWIAFCLVSLAICLGSRKISWFNTGGHDTGEFAAIGASDETASNPAAAYLMPFLTILGAALVTRAVTSDFEWTYGLRVLAAGAALWYFRRSYRELDWRCGPSAFVIGGAVFALWIGLDRFAGVTGSAMPGALKQAATGVQLTWIALRVIGAVVTVPIAEELAFRGFLLRRVASSEFESVDLRRFSWIPFLVSSLAFGMLHGDRYIAGAIAGMFYAWAVMRRGRIGDAVVAHAFTNALIAIWVLSTGHWELW